MKLPELPQPVHEVLAHYSKQQMLDYARAAVLAERKAINKALALTVYPVQGTPYAVAGGPFQRAVDADIAKRDKE